MLSNLISLKEQITTLCVQVDQFVWVEMINKHVVHIVLVMSVSDVIGNVMEMRLANLVFPVQDPEVSVSYLVLIILLLHVMDHRETVLVLLGRHAHVRIPTRELVYAEQELIV
jgi:hypothetical protein